MRRGLLAALAGAICFVVAGCGGGGGGGNAPGGAGVVPASAPIFISFDTDVGSQQWRQATALVRKFPDSARALRMFAKEAGNLDFDRDVKPALGPEVDVVWLDFANNGNDVVGLTRPKSDAKLTALLKKLDRSDPTSPPTVTAKLKGWTLVADSQAKLDAFKRAAANGKMLADDKRFADAIGRVSEDAAARAYVNGAAVQQLIDRSIAASGAPVRARDFFSWDTLAAAAIARSDGVKVEADAALQVPSVPEPESAKLPKTLPGGALLYVSLSGLDRAIRQTLRGIAKAQPNFDQQRAQVEGVLGISIDRDVLPLFSGESAFAIYPQSPLPQFVFVQSVGDEQKARRLVERVGPILNASGELHVRPARIGGVSANELVIPNQPFSVFYGLVGDKLVISNARAAFEGVTGSGGKLADDPLYKAAVKGAGAPGATSGFVYANLHDGLPVVFDFAQAGGSNIPQVARTNTRPLQGSILWFKREDKRFRLSGFVGIK